MTKVTDTARWSKELDALAQLADECLRGENNISRETAGVYLEALQQAGFRQDYEGPPLQKLVEDRVVDKYPEPAIHRRAELQGILKEVQRLWNTWLI